MREFIIYIPQAYNGSKSVPLFINFHGFGGTMEDHLLWADMRPIADTENFILVYPQGLPIDGPESTHWNASFPGADNKSPSDDQGFIRYLTEQVGLVYQIDANRIYAAGYSNGGFFSYFLGCFSSDIFAAVGSVSGTMLDDSYQGCSPSHPMGMINLHGTADMVVPYDGGSEGLTSIPNVVQYWVDFNGAESTPIVTNEGNIEKRLYPASTGAGGSGVSIEHYKFVGGGHVWFDNTFQGKDTGRLLWEYVSMYDRQGLIP